MLFMMMLLLFTWAKADNSACPTFDLSKGSEMDLDYVLVDSVVKQEPLLLVGLGAHSTPPPEGSPRSAPRLPERFKYPVESTDNYLQRGALLHGEHGQTWLYLQSGLKRWYFVKTQSGQQASTEGIRVSQEELVQREGAAVLCSILQHPGTIMYLPEKRECIALAV